ncbi:hypothetical protein RFI_31459 [Reticulomyxa filosa]|uniref:Uncharacterized protein n=1 Tax=Reticulomyxa filosa TaxID=46433 RepID=X6LX75_RETFI|nr:hypothetical protein RFI_31459 [Reticulomyxa filosa]|eukprot:ETO05936.1 hypothetical protein RFI_31459 [Reticulomyxa filosa]
MVDRSKNYEMRLNDVWDIFFSDEKNWHVQLYLKKNINMLYDFSDKYSFIPRDNNSSWQIGQRSGIYVEDAINLWFPDTFTNGITWEKDKPLFRKIVDMNKVQEYQNWFENDRGEWIKLFGY